MVTDAICYKYQKWNSSFYVLKNKQIKQIKKNVF